VGYWKASDAYDTARPQKRQWELLPHFAAPCRFPSSAPRFDALHKNSTFTHRSFEIFVHLCYDIEKEAEEPFAPLFPSSPTKGANTMKFTYTCKKVSLNDSVKAYAEKKVGKLEKFFKEEPEASVTFSVEKKNRCVAEIMLRGANGTLFRAVCEDPDGDMRGAIDEATAQIERKIRKNKTRLAKNLRAEAVMPELPEEFEAHEEGTFDIVRTKRFTVKPMSVEEAILQMNLLSHSFFVFRNTDALDAICVVYRRNNGGYGIIETEDDEE